MYTSTGMGRRLALGLGLMTVAFAPPAAQATLADPSARVTVEQPSGRSFTAKLFGDEWSNGYETLAGYTVVQTPQSKAWRYAKLTDGGELRPSKTGAMEPPPAAVDRHLREENPLDGVEAGAIADPARAPSPENIGTQRSLVILAQFADQPSLGTTPAEWSSRFFGASDSVADFYDKASYGALDIQPASETSGTADDGVVGWVTLTGNHPNFTLGSSAEFQRAHSTARDAIIAANPFIDYASYDTDGNGSLSSDELHITVVAAGWEASQGCGAPKAWAHKTGINGQGVAAPLVDGTVAGGDYTMFGEQHCLPSPHMATLGVMVHEMGHDLGLPDMYDVNGGSDGGVGDWSVMANSWLAGSGDLAGSDPSMPDAWSKYYEGWTAPQGIAPGTSPQAIGVNSGSGLTDTGTAVRLLDNPGGVDWTWEVARGAGEYFLVENRQQVGYDNALPGCGLVIWHIDETRTSTNNANADQSRRLVDLVEADDDNDTYGDASDVWRAGAFNGTSVPSSDLYSYANSGVSVDQFTSSCGATMSARFATDVFPPTPPNDSFANAILLSGTTPKRDDDTNVEASKEAGEPNHVGDPGGRSVWYSWTAPTTARVAVDTFGTNFDTILAVYTGSAVNALTPVGSDDESGGNGASVVGFNATAGTTYKIAVDGYAGGGAPASGMFDLAISPAPPNDNFASAMTLSGRHVARNTDTNAGASKELGEPNHSQNAAGVSIWYSWTAPSSGTVNMTIGASNFYPTLDVYTGPSVNALTQIASLEPPNFDSLSFAAVSGTTYRIAVDAFAVSGMGAQGIASMTLDLDDATPPETTIASGPADGSWINDTTPTFTFISTEPPSTFECRLTAGPVGSGSFSACSTPLTTSSLAEGQWLLEVRAKDGADNLDPSPATRAFTIDTTPPTVSIESGPTGSTTDALPTFAFTPGADATGTPQCSIDTGIPSFADCSTATSHTPAAALVGGAYTFRVQVDDAAGNTATATREFHVDLAVSLPPDTTPPETTITGVPGKMKVRKKGKAAFEFTSNEPANSFRCSIDGQDPTQCGSPVSYTVKPGKHHFEVYAIDAAGNEDPVPAVHDFKVKKKPKKRK